MSGSLIFLIVIGIAVWLWLDGARARETAVQIAQTMCNKRGFQLLDDSVHLERTGLSWSNSGVRIRRMFDFDFSTEGTGRRSGYIILRGSSLEQADLGLPTDPKAEKDITPESTPAVPKKTTTSKSNVVQLHKPKKK